MRGLPRRTRLSASAAVATAIAMEGGRVRTGRSTPRRLATSARPSRTDSVAPLRTYRSPGVPRSPRSEEHTSELQSHVNLVCRLLLEKKKKKQKTFFILKKKKKNKNKK